MALSTTTADNGTITIAVTGKFDFNVHRDFSDAYKTKSNGKSNYVIDLAGTEYMDSSALGMLLLLREHAGGESATISIKNARSEIKDILTIANFQKLFTIT